MRQITLPAKMTRQEKRSISESMAKYAPTVLRGDLNEPSTWRCALRRIGVKVIVARRDASFVACFNPVSESRRYPIGEVTYNLARSKRMQVRGLAHEFGHALCQKWIPQMIFDADVVFSFHDDPRDTRHQIARMFDELMIGKRSR